MSESILGRARAVIPNRVSSRGRAKFEQADADLDETVSAAVRALGNVA